MEGYASENYKVFAEDGNHYVLKYHQNISELKTIKAEHKLLLHLAKNCPIQVSQPTGPKKGIRKHSTGFSRVLTFLDGKFLGETEHSNRLLFNFGQSIAQLDLAMIDFENNNLKAYHHDWDLNRCLTVWPMMKYIEDFSDRKLVNYYFDQYKANVTPVIPTLRHSIIHNDLNDWNILTRNDLVSGIIDFGDVCYAPLINNLAVALTYIMLSKPFPVRAACHVIKGYQEKLPLTREEVELLYYLIPARLCQSVCHSARKKALGDDTEYVRISEAPAWELLRKWSSFNPIYIKRRFGKAANFLDNPGSNTHRILQTRQKHLSSSMSLSYQRPIHMTGASFQYMYDAEGNSYLDAYNNIPHIGHSHPRVSIAISTQIRKLNTNTRYIYESIAEYTEKLLYRFPPHLSKVFFVNSGSAATDLAVRLARQHTQRKHMLVLQHGYHGNSIAGIGISSYKFEGKGGEGKPADITVLPLPKLHKGKFSTVEEYVKNVEVTLDGLLKSGIEPAAFIAEPISGCGGQVPLAPGYWKAIQNLLKGKNILNISDEVQVGFGRTGSHFWGFDLHAVAPDIVILGKPMANGHPIGAVVTTEEIATSFETGMEFFSSFGGNPVSLEAANAVLAVIEDEQLQSNAGEVGSYFLNQLKSLSNKHMGDIRGHGLFLGVEFENPETGEPDTAFAQKVKNLLREKYILTSTDGPCDNVLKMKPPLCFSKQNVDQFMEVFEAVLTGTPTTGFVPGKVI